LVPGDFFVVPTASFRILYVFIYRVREPGIAQHYCCEDRNSLYTAFVLGHSGHAAGPAFMKGTVQIGISLALMAAIGFIMLAVLPRNPRTTARIPSKLRSHFLPLLEGFRALERRGGIFKAALLSAAIWLCITSQLWCFTRAYLDLFPFSGLLLLMVLTVVGVAILTPAGVGGFQSFMSIALVRLFSQYLSPNDSHSQAAGISNGTCLASMGPVLILGLVLLNYEGLSLGWMTRIAPPNARGGENT
jgi:hypothetical protein